MADKLIKHKIIEGCHDCPMLEVLPFGDIRCEYVNLEDVYVDPLDPKPPPPGCPLLYNGAIMITLGFPPDAKGR